MQTGAVQNGAMQTGAVQNGAMQTGAVQNGAMQITVNGSALQVDDPSATLLDVLRAHGLRSVKDGCSPQGQCGCCTVLVDGKPRVSCVTPVRRMRGRSITTIEGLPADVAAAWGDAFAAAGASQCGFCTPGIVCRFVGLQGTARPTGSQNDSAPVVAGDANELGLSGDAADTRGESEAAASSGRDGATDSRERCAQAEAAVVPARPDRQDAAEALLAHMCRCTGWQTVLDAWDSLAAWDSSADRGSSPGGGGSDPSPDPSVRAGAKAGSSGARSKPSRASSDRSNSQLRARIEGGVAQQTGAHVALGGGGFADDTAPADALVAVLAGDDWVVAPSRAEALRLAGKVQGRRTTAAFEPPLDLPPADGAGREWAATLRTSWVEPGYLETDAAWCEPGGEPAGPLANGGAFGAKQTSPVAEAARRLADEHDRPVRVLYTREDSVRLGPKRPPMAAGLRSDGSGLVRVARTPGIVEAIRATAPGAEVVEVDIAGPPTSAAIRCAGRLEMEALLAALRGEVGWVTLAGGGSATAVIADDGSIDVRVRCGDPLDETVLRSYCIGAAHMGLSLVTSESLAVDPSGEVHDLTVRSFGILRAVDTPEIRVTIEQDDGPAVNGSDAVFMAAAAAAWLNGGCKPVWPTGRLIASRPTRPADRRSPNPAG